MCIIVFCIFWLILAANPGPPPQPRGAHVLVLLHLGRYPHRLSHHERILVVFGIPKGEYHIIQGVVQRQTQKPCPGLAALWNDSAMYMYYIDVECVSLMIVAQSTVHTWCSRGREELLANQDHIQE